VVQRQVFRAFSTFALAAALLAVGLVLTSRPAFADAKNEAAAKALEQKAMQEDYLNTDFDKAIDKLRQASAKCGSDKCSSIVRASIQVNVGVIQLAGKQNRDAAIAAFVDALKTDSNAAVDNDLRSKEIDAAFAEAKKQVGSGASGGGPPAAGDFSITPPPGQLVRTPLDVYFTYGGSDTLAKVVVKYKGFGMTEWKTLEAHAVDKGWGAEIPCADVQQGDLVYYLQGFNANNDPIATGGDRNNPYKTAVTRDFSGDAPHFPGKDPPKQCADAGDCPPDFPGCKKGGGDEAASNLKSEGDACEEDAECKSGTCTTDKVCAAGGDEEKPANGKRKKFWIGVAGQWDIAAVPGANQACLLYGPGQPPGNTTNTSATPVNTGGYYCTNNGSDFPSRANATQNSQISPNVDDKVQGGFAPANIRVMVTFDYAATANLLVGGRVGYVANTYDGQAAKNEGKTSFMGPVHLEARGTYVLGRDPIANAGLAPYLMGALGVSTWDGGVNVTVAQNPTFGNATTTAKAWVNSGPFFLSAGGGIRYAFSPRAALLVGPRLNLAFGSVTMFSISPELGLQYGF
jgi:hypothetical protein